MVKKSDIQYYIKNMRVDDIKINTVDYVIYPKYIIDIILKDYMEKK